MKSKQQNKTWLKRGDKRLQVTEQKLTPKKTMLLLLVVFTCSPPKFSKTGLTRGVTVTAETMVDFFKATSKRFWDLIKKIRYRSESWPTALTSNSAINSCFPVSSSTAEESNIWTEMSCTVTYSTTFDNYLKIWWNTS